MQPNQQNPYDFITSTAPKKRGFGFGGNSQKARIIQVAIFGLALVIIGVVVLSILSNANKSTANTLIELAAAQQDIIAIAKDGSSNSRDANSIKQIATISTVVSSQNYQTLALISANGNKKPGKQIAALQVTTYTKTLDDAKKNGNYDEVFSALLANRLDEYQVKLRAAYAAAKGTKLKSQLSDFYQQIETASPAAAK